MSTANLAKPKSGTECWQWVIAQYQNAHPGPFDLTAFLTWALEADHVSLPKVDPMKVLRQEARKAIRAARVTDAQGRTVRAMIPAKVPTAVDENGNMLLFDIQYDHIHSMSLSHAIQAFDQADERIEKQKKAARRNLDSFLENNPAGKKQGSLFDHLDFMADTDANADTVRVDVFPDSPTKPR